MKQVSRESALARAVFDAAVRAGVADFECAVLDARSARVVFSGGAIETLEERGDQGIGVRVWVDRRPGFAFTSNCSPDGIARAVGAARDLAEFTAPDPANEPPAPARPAALPFPNTDAGFDGFPATRKIDLARDVERAARAFSPEVDRVRRACYRDLRWTMHIANSRGVAVETSLTRAWLSVETAARRGADQRTGGYIDWALGPAGLDAERVGRTGARRAVDALGARRGPTGRLPVVLDPECTSALLEALSPAFSGLRALRGRTVLLDRLGRKIGAPCVTLVDDATLPGIWGATPVDGEGRPTGRHVLVESGVLQKFINDSFTARRRGDAPTGHAQRGGYSSPPAIGVHCLHLTPTGETRGELLARAAGGLLVTDLMGLHTVNPATGEFSLGAAGREILAGGELGAPLDQFAISGAIFQLLESITAVADDLEFFAGSSGGASVLLADTPVSGAQSEE